MGRKKFRLLREEFKKRNMKEVWKGEGWNGRKGRWGKEREQRVEGGRKDKNTEGGRKEREEGENTGSEGSKERKITWES